MNIPLRPLDQSYTSPLDQIRVAEPPAEVESTGRMSTGMCFTTYVQLGEQLKLAIEQYQSLLECGPKLLTATLKGLVENCKYAQEKAEKLLTGNK